MSAAERAAEMLSQFSATTDGEAENYRIMVAALMADPDLLVDLAIEAGGLRVWGSWEMAYHDDGSIRCNHDGREYCTVEHETQPLYRRVDR